MCQVSARVGRLALCATIAEENSTLMNTKCDCLIFYRLHNAHCTQANGRCSIFPISRLLHIRTSLCSSWRKSANYACDYGKVSAAKSGQRNRVRWLRVIDAWTMHYYYYSARGLTYVRSLHGCVCGFVCEQMPRASYRFVSYLFLVEHKVQYDAACSSIHRYLTVSTLCADMPARLGYCRLLSLFMLKTE